MPRPLRRTASVLIAVLLACLFAFPQEIRFAVIADTHVGAGNAAAELEAIVARINGLPGVAFVVIAGDITEKGGSAEFVEARRILDKLAAPYYALPGNHDSHWLGYGLAGFRNTWRDDKFLFQKNETYFIGIHGWDLGHVSPQDLLWLEHRVSECPPSSTICLFIHNPLSSLDNGFAVSNILRGRRAFVISGHVHRNEEVEYNGIPGTTVRAAIRGKKASWGFTLVRDMPDDLCFYEAGETGEPELWGIISKSQPREVPEIHRSPFENFGVDILWIHDLKTRLSAPLASWNDLIYSADDSGKLTCFGAKGKVLWTFDAGESFVSRPAVFDGSIWAAPVGGRILKLEAQTGRLLKSADIKERAQSQLTVFPFRDGQKQGLLIGTGSGKMMCLDAGSLEILWANRDAAGAIQSRPLVTAGKVIYGSWDGRLRCLDAAGSGLGPRTPIFITHRPAAFRKPTEKTSSSVCPTGMSHLSTWTPDRLGGGRSTTAGSPSDSRKIGKKFLSKAGPTNSTLSRRKAASPSGKSARPMERETSCRRSRSSGRARSFSPPRMGSSIESIPAAESRLCSFSERPGSRRSFISETTCLRPRTWTDGSPFFEFAPRTER